MATRQGTVEEFTTEFGLTPQEGLDINQTVQGAGQAVGSDVSFEVPVSQFAQTPAGIIPSISDPAGDFLTKNQAELGDESDDDIRQNTLGLFQDEINATKGAYAQLLEEARAQGRGRLGENTAIQARRGLLGSSFGAAKTEGVRSLNQSKQQEVLREQARALAGIKSTAVQLAQEEINSRRTAKQNGAAAIAEHLRTAPERRQNHLANIAASLLTQGTDPLTLDPDVFNKDENLIKMGITADDIVSYYLQTKQVKDKEDSALEREQLLEDRDFGLQSDKFAEDKRQFGLDYALKQADLAIKQGKAGGENTSKGAEFQAERAARTIESVRDLKMLTTSNPEIFGRSAAVPLPRSLRGDAYRNFTSQLDTLKASIAFGELTAMREASKTGGALGQVSNIELGLLESALGALRMDQSPQNFLQQLDKIEQSITRWSNASSQEQSGGEQSARRERIEKGGVIYEDDGTGNFVPIN